MSVESWKSAFDLVTVVLLFLTFAAGAGVLVTGNIVNKRQEGKLRRFDADLTIARIDLAKQQERAAMAEGHIALAEQHAAEADAKAEGFKAEIAKANASAAEANLEALSSRLEALHSVNAAKILGVDVQQNRADRYSFFDNSNPRKLTSGQKEAITRSVLQIGPFQSLDIFASAREPLDFGISIAQSLSDWSVDFFNVVDPKFAGLLIEYDPKNEAAEKSAFTLYRELSSFGFRISAPTPSLPKGNKRELSSSGIPANAPVRIVIGSKPKITS